MVKVGVLVLVVGALCSCHKDVDSHSDDARAAYEISIKCLVQVRAFEQLGHDAKIDVSSFSDLDTRLEAIVHDISGRITNPSVDAERDLSDVKINAMSKATNDLVAGDTSHYKRDIGICSEKLKQFEKDYAQVSS